MINKYIFEFFLLWLIVAQCCGQAADFNSNRTPDSKVSSDVIQPAERLASSTHLVWEHDLPKSLQLAKNLNKLVLIDVYTQWCGWCKRLDRDTYSDPSVIQFLSQDYVCVKMDAEDNGQGQAVASRYGIHGYPAILVLEPSGRMKGIFYGYLPARAFPEAVRKIRVTAR